MKSLHYIQVLLLFFLAMRVLLRKYSFMVVVLVLPLLRRWSVCTAVTLLLVA